MKYWNRKKIVRGSAPKSITRIGLALIAAIEAGDADWPKLLRMGRHDRDDDLHRYEVEVELAPGLVLPMEYGLTEELDTDPDETSYDEAGVLDWTLEGVEACIPNLEYLADEVHEARKSARATVVEWQKQGLPVRFVDVHLAPYDHWRGSFEPLTRVLLETLDRNLQPAVEKLDSQAEPDAVSMFADAHHDLRQRTEQRDALMRQGATGFINQLALNAISQVGDVAVTLRRFRSEWRFRLADDTRIRIEDGMVDAANYVEENRFSWDRDGFSVSAAVELKCDVVTAIGRPVTEFIEHRFLSRDMSVLKAEWSLDHTGERRLHVDLAMPLRLFCSTTGRVWDAAHDGRNKGNVVPFGRRHA
jgi:hypothetical protein